MENSSQLIVQFQNYFSEDNLIVHFIERTFVNVIGAVASAVSVFWFTQVLGVVIAHRSGVCRVDLKKKKACCSVVRRGVRSLRFHGPHERRQTISVMAAAAVSD
uniref:Transmembrane protein n=1 Tax=Schizaphis graminum TaxID=13262 RepID=A0A2S2PRY3_SCHGA